MTDRVKQIIQDNEEYYGRSLDSALKILDYPIHQPYVTIRKSFEFVTTVLKEIMKED